MELFRPSGLLGMKLQCQFVGFQAKRELFSHPQLLRGGFSTVSRGSLSLGLRHVQTGQISIPLQPGMDGSALKGFPRLKQSSADTQMEPPLTRNLRLCHLLVWTKNHPENSLDSSFHQEGFLPNPQGWLPGKVTAEALWITAAPHSWNSF